MGTVKSPCLLILPRLWLVGGYKPERWRDEWQEWQNCGVCLPVALHRLQLQRGSAFAGDFGELDIYYTTDADGVAAGRDLEALYSRDLADAKIDPADALHVVLYGAASDHEANFPDDAATTRALAVGASIAGACSATIADCFDGPEPDRAASEFAWTWYRIIQYQPAVAFPRWPSRVPAYLDECRSKHPELFK